MAFTIFLANPNYKIPIGKKHERYFIRAGSRWPHSGVKRKTARPHYLPFPMQLGYASAWLRQEGFSVHTMDAVALDVTEPALMEAVERLTPDLFFFETSTPTIDFDLTLVKELRRRFPRMAIVLGGAHATVNARPVLEKSPEVNFVIRGEYEETLLKLAKALSTQSPTDSLLGISFIRDGQLVETTNAPAIDPIDAMPDPAYDLFPASWEPNPTIYWDGFCQHRPSIQMNASRGCPYRCDFCLWIQVMYRNGKYRVFSPERLVTTMLQLQQRYGVREFYFDDDDFCIQKGHVTALCNEIINRGLRVRWSCMADAINLTEDLLTLMAKSGCVGVKFGVETGSESLTKSLGKPVKLQRVKDIVRWCSRLRIKTHATFTLGLFGEDRQTLRETLRFLSRLNVDTIQVSLCTPFPGTAFYEKARSTGTLQSMDWSTYDGKSSDVVAHSGMSGDEMDRMRRIALTQWFLHRLCSPSWLWRQLHYAVRVVNGMGLVFLLTQIRDILIDEYLLPLTSLKSGRPTPVAAASSTKTP